MKALDRVVSLRYPVRRGWARVRTRFSSGPVFVHINKTGGSSIEKALGLPLQHLTATELRDLIGPARWERRFSFGFVRNPWDRVVSHYHYRIKTGQTGLGGVAVPFREWVIRAYGERDPELHDQPRMFMPQYLWLCDEDSVEIVDFVGRFERLHEDFAEVCRRVDVEVALPHLKRSSHRDYRELYDDETRDVVGRVFAGDVNRYGYDFG